jgi:hypothetical protein
VYYTIFKHSYTIFNYIVIKGNIIFESERFSDDGQHRKERFMIVHFESTSKICFWVISHELAADSPEYLNILLS